MRVIPAPAEDTGLSSLIAPDAGQPPSVGTRSRSRRRGGTVEGGRAVRRDRWRGTGFLPRGRGVSSCEMKTKPGLSPGYAFPLGADRRPPRQWHPRKGLAPVAAPNGPVGVRRGVKPRRSSPDAGSTPARSSVETTTAYAKSPWEGVEHFDLGDGLTQAELYHWAVQKRLENLDHIRVGHDRTWGMCPSCGNCQCGRFKGFRCICEFGKVYVTPYRVRKRQ